MQTISAESILHQYRKSVFLKLPVQRNISAAFDCFDSRQVMEKILGIRIRKRKVVHTQHVFDIELDGRLDWSTQNTGEYGFPDSGKRQAFP